VIKPPITTVAKGRCTSAPVLVAIAIGMNPRLATSAVITAPWRGIGAIVIFATSRSSTGTPPRASTTILPRSSWLSARPSPDRLLLLGVRDETAAEVLVVVGHSGQDVVDRHVVTAQRVGIHFDDYCLVKPPQELTSLTPGTARRS
jgi:hypothetical protein